jgi:phage tail-like protein
MYPLTGLHFEVRWDGEEQPMSFSEVSGLTLEVESIEYRGGADVSLGPSMVPGKHKTGKVAFKRGVMTQANGNRLYEWYATAQTNTVERRSVTVTLLNERREPAMTWKLFQAWITKLEAPAMKANGNEIAIESVELVVEKIEVEVAGG